MYNICICTTKVKKKENYEPIRREERYKKDRSFPTQILLILFYEIKKGKKDENSLRFPIKSLFALFTVLEF